MILSPYIMSFYTTGIVVAVFSPMMEIMSHLQYFCKGLLEISDLWLLQHPRIGVLFANYKL